MPGYKDRASILEGAGDTIFKLVCDRATPEQWAEWLRTPLEHAAGTGNHELASKLLRAGANGNAGWQGCHGKTLLHAGAEGGNETIMETLMWKCAADKDTRDTRDGCTPLHRAVLDGKEGIAKMLIMARADVNIRDSKSNVPLHLAIKGGHVGLAELLLLSGADPNRKALNDSSPVKMATALGQNQIVRSLIQSGANLNCLDMMEETPLGIGVREERVSTVKLLLAGGADPNFTRSSLYRRTVLHQAAKSNKVASMPALIEAGAKIDACDAYRTTPLYTAVFHDSCAAVRVLLQLGAQVDKKCQLEQLTPLHAACEQSNPDAADLLLRWGADETATDDEGNTPSSKIPAIDRAAKDDRPRLERLSKLLSRAPQDRAWRRRGFLVMCRAFPDRVRLESKTTDTIAVANGQLAERPCNRARREQVQDEVGTVRGGPAGDGGNAICGARAEGESVDDGFEKVAAWLMVLTDKEALRKVVAFL